MTNHTNSHEPYITLAQIILNHNLACQDMQINQPQLDLPYGIWAFPKRKVAVFERIGKTTAGHVHNAWFTCAI